MRVLLFVCEVNMLRDYKGDGNVGPVMCGCGDCGV